MEALNGCLAFKQTNVLVESKLSVTKNDLPFHYIYYMRKWLKYIIFFFKGLFIIISLAILCDALT